MNTAYCVNILLRELSSMETQAGDVLLRLLECAKGFTGWQISHKFDRAYDLLAVGQSDAGATIELWVEFKADPRPSQFPYVGIETDFESQKIKRARAQVFAAPFISPRMAEVCWDHGWGWFDLAGNCRIGVPGIGLYIERTGLPPVHDRPPLRANLGTNEAARVVRAVFSFAGKGTAWTQRELQSSCHPGVSLGLVNKVVNYLKDERLVEPTDSGALRLRDPLALLSAWREAYRFDKVRQVRLFTLAKREAIDAALRKIASKGEVKAAYAAFSAAEILAPAVRQPRQWLMVSPECAEEIRQDLDAKPAESGDNLVLLVPPDDGPFFDAHVRADLPVCTSALQTHVDVAHLAGRGEEAAEAILEQVLKPAWKAKGLL
jgi:hypothetical protein